MVNSMRKDDVSFYIRVDTLICQNGESQSVKQGHDKSRHQYIAERMRFNMKFGHFMLKAKAMDKAIMSS